MRFDDHDGSRICGPSCLQLELLRAVGTGKHDVVGDRDCSDDSDLAVEESSESSAIVVAGDCCVFA